VASPALLLPGDLIFIPGSDGNMSDPGHVGLYIGQNLIVQAPRTGDVCQDQLARLVAIQDRQDPPRRSLAFL
jgi:cell wall-associated NlpC family hydrolase